VVAVLISLAASALWGGADFIGGLVTKRHGVLAVVAFVEGAGLVGIAVLLAISGEPLPPSSDLVNAAIAGLCGVTGLALFYQALSIGTMSIVAPVSSCGAAIPAVYGVATGDPLSLVLGLGILVAMVGIILASLEAEHEGVEQVREGSRLSLVLAGLSAFGFGGYFIFFDRATGDSVLWSLATARSVPLAVLVVVIAVRRIPLPRGRDAQALVLAGITDAGATGLYGIALTKGALSVVSVVGSLYPVTTVLLARVVLGERVRTIQAVGIVLALTGVALIAAG
jgi:drug/metabolite transporter (DMT)-like permease